MSTECNQFVFGFHPLKHREIRAQFDGGAITTESGGLLLREVEKRIGIVRQFVGCFRYYRNPDLIEHTVEELAAQRSTAWLLKISMITRSCGTILCWRCWFRSPIWRERCWQEKAP